MEESSHKRQREEEEEETDLFKRQKSYEIILSFLEEDEDVSPHDLSSLITTLEQEISSSSNESSSATNDSSISEYAHLLEASDDELGIPNIDYTEVIGEGDSRGEAAVEEVGGGDLLLQPVIGGGDGLLWEIEDETANYYALLQSQLFL